MAIHKKAPEGLHVSNYGSMCSLGGLMACRADYDIIVLRSVHACFSSSYYFLAIFDEDALRRLMSQLTAI